MAEVGPGTSRRARTGASYASQWNRFVAWSQTSGKRSLPASPQDVAAYPEDRLEAVARPSTLPVASAAIARNHKVAGFDVTFRYDTARTVLDRLTREEVPDPSRALPLNLDCYLAIRKTAQEPRPGRGGRLERVASARNLGAVDIAMIGLMRDARLRVSEAASLIWGDAVTITPTNTKNADTGGRPGRQVADASAYGHLPSQSKPNIAFQCPVLRTASASRAAAGPPLPRRLELAPAPAPAHAGSGVGPGERVSRGPGTWVRPPTWLSPFRSPPGPPGPARPDPGHRRTRCAGRTRAVALRWWPGLP